jgi:hypothetical protein
MGLEMGAGRDWESGLSGQRQDAASTRYSLTSAPRLQYNWCTVAGMSEL